MQRRHAPEELDAALQLALAPALLVRLVVLGEEDGAARRRQGMAARCSAAKMRSRRWELAPSSWDRSVSQRRAA